MGTRVVRYDGCECCEGGGGGTVETECCEEPLPETLYVTMHFVADDVTIEFEITYNAGTGYWEGTHVCGNGDYAEFALNCNKDTDTWEWQFFGYTADDDWVGELSETAIDEVTCSPFLIDMTDNDSSGFFEDWCGVTAAMSPEVEVTITE